MSAWTCRSTDDRSTSSSNSMLEGLVNQEIARVGKKRHRGGSAVQKLPLEILRDDENTVGLARMDFALRTGEVRQHHGDRNVGRGIDPAGEIPACPGAVAGDHRDPHGAQSLRTEEHT